MLDLGLDKLALIGAVALIVIGPEKLPKVARTVGHMMGKARRYVADVKAEVNRSIEMEELAKARKQFEDAAHEVGSTVQGSFNEAAQTLSEPFDADAWNPAPAPASPTPPKKNWRLKRSRTPQWFKQTAGVRQHVQSGAARVKRHRR
ncbi:Sec-independent protein translocase protein TatB [Pseudorhodoferax sp.]|jgi:sec-independent protein translocase protein TatB|uniref:Sec-independent protein translocase protein TatB n=1 Tax=Pseudorhodoferax sp. TaxID=1993553 RepID=UPI001B4B8022|nr:Sec-independent protein translocase protein TatB [Pseudorhodoferax sp.]MBP8145602.1 Sec-independent protein translocase subunit TatB [Inhella sp.]